MRTSTCFTILLGTVATAQAFELSDISKAVSNGKRAFSTVVDGVKNVVRTYPSWDRDTDTCPPVWNEISTILTAIYLADGQCTDAARAAIRAAFHDCFNGACDGSLILANECANSENAGLERLCSQIGALASEKDVGVADLIQFAAAHAIKTCPGGPTIPVKIGRKDSYTASPMGGLPSASSSAGDLIEQFGRRGFSVRDLVALIGAHSTGRQRTTDPSRAGAPFDQTPGTWDTSFYQETRDGEAPFTLQSDKALADALVSGAIFRQFANNQGAWAGAFVPAMARMSVLGVEGRLVDCTGALPGGSAKRDVKRSGVFDRV